MCSSSWCISIRTDPVVFTALGGRTDTSIHRTISILVVRHIRPHCLQASVQPLSNHPALSEGFPSSQGTPHPLSTIMLVFVKSGVILQGFPPTESVSPYRFSRVITRAKKNPAKMFQSITTAYSTRRILGPSPT